MHSSTLLVSLLLIAVPLTVLAQYDMYIVEDPHILSINNGEETCYYWSNTWFECFSSPFFKVICIFEQAYISTGLVPTMLSSIQLEFQHPLLGYFVSYIALSPSETLPSTFTNGNSLINDNNGNPWLEINMVVSYSGYSKVYINDYNTLTTITIEQFGGVGPKFFNLYITTDPATLQFATGLLISGCPNGYNPYNPSGRRRRSISECEKLASSQKGDESNRVLSSEIIQKICEHDIKYIPNIVEQLQLVIKTFAEHKEIHNKLIEYGKEKLEKRIIG